MSNIAWSRAGQAGRYGLLALTLVLAGCQASLDAYPQRPFDTALPRVEPIDSIQVSQIFYQQPTEELRRSYRDQIIASRIAAINISYRLFEEQLFQEGTARNIATDLALLGLAGAGATVANSGTQQILAAVSGGLVGARAAFDKNALFDRTLPSLVAKMEASRRQVEERLLNGMKLDTNAYGIIEALADLDSYFNAGTLPGAILNIAGDAGALKTEILKQRTFSAKSLDQSGKALIPLLTGASGTIDPARVKQLRTCLGVVGLPADILLVDFVYGGEFIADRAKVLACMQALPAAVPPAPAQRVGASGRRLPFTSGLTQPPVDVAELNAQFKELLKDPQTGTPTAARFALIKSCYPRGLARSMLPGDLEREPVKFANEKKAIIDCMGQAQLNAQLNTQFKELLKDPQTGAPTAARFALIKSCYPRGVAPSILPGDLEREPVKFANEKKAIIDCMKATNPH